MDVSLSGLGAVSAALSDLRPVMAALGDKARAVILEEGRRDTGGDLILSHMRRVRIDVKVEAGESAVTLTAVPPGPWMLLEAGSHKGSWIEPRGYGRRQRKRIRLPDGSVRRYVQHGPVRARNTFTRARQRVEQMAPGWLDAEISALVKRAA